MKTKCLALIFVLFFFCFVGRIQAQTTQPKLNQLELSRQTFGTWETKMPGDSTYIFNLEPYGTGAVGWGKITYKDKVIMEGKILAGYDKTIDKIIIAYLVEGRDLELTVRWYTSNNKYERVLYKDIDNPAVATIRWEAEIKSPDMFIEKIFRKNTQPSIKTWTRVK
jgi:hypothetical protein